MFTTTQAISTLAALLSHLTVYIKLLFIDGRVGGVGLDSKLEGV